ncbi:MAG: 2,3-bisphosphoglycerate-independent phosphoglycerate mutase [Dehalococcoidales bacterium]|nr:2,3-bisphosphoglycerate-independent phosphoglycerate mutase [Dehalococcoidales bacterium]
MNLVKDIAIPSPSKIVLLVIDGLGGLPDSQSGKTELETARHTNMDELVTKGICGLVDPVAPGITPGSAPGHLALFGYDPIECAIGRGILEAVGIGFALQPGDVAARGNFCTIDDKGLITDRRAGRIATEKCVELAKLLDERTIENVKVIVRPVKEHRLVTIFRGEGLEADAGDSDPQQTGMAPKPVMALNPGAEKLARVANIFLMQAKLLLADHHPANMVLLRGFSKHPHLPSMSEIYKLKPAAIAVYPMYRGLASLAGMEILETGVNIEDEFATLEQNFNKCDFFFIHIKATDAAGEDADFARKVRAIEQIDRALPRLIKLKPDVLVITGDHSTPALLGGHSWHPVPMLLNSKWCRSDRVMRFGESDCIHGGLGRIPATSIMPLAMANALKLTKYGA